MPRQVCEWIAKFTVFLYLNLRQNLEPTLLPPLEVFSRVAWLYRHQHPVELTLPAYESMLGQKNIKNIVAGLRQNISDSSRQIFLLDPTSINMLRNDLSNGANERLFPRNWGSSTCLLLENFLDFSKQTASEVRLIGAHLKCMLSIPAAANPIRPISMCTFAWILFTGLDSDG